MRKDRILIDRVWYTQTPEGVSEAFKVMGQSARKVDGDLTFVQAQRQVDGELKHRLTTSRTWTLKFPSMAGGIMFDHLLWLYSNQTAFVIQLDALMSRRYAALQYVDQPIPTKWATPTYPIVPVDHNGEDPYDWTGALRINNRPYSGAYEVDPEEGIVTFPSGVVTVNTRVQLKYEWRALVYVEAMTNPRDLVIDSTRDVTVLLRECGVPDYDCGAFEDALADC